MQMISSVSLSILQIPQPESTWQSSWSIFEQFPQKLDPPSQRYSWQQIHDPNGGGCACNNFSISSLQDRHSAVSKSEQCVTVLGQPSGFLTQLVNDLEGIWASFWDSVGSHFPSLLSPFSGGLCSYHLESPGMGSKIIYFNKWSLRQNLLSLDTFRALACLEV